ncbi:MAG: DoxX family membrane protein [Chloroflexota bacterium]
MRITDRKHALAIAIGRIGIGVIFLWAGLEKIIGGGLGTWSAKGFLELATDGSLGWPFVTGEVAEGTVFNPTHDVWVGLAGNEAALTVIGLMVPLGQLGVGIALILGLLTRFGAAVGTLMMLFFFVAAWDFQFGIVNQHLTYAVVTLGLGVVGAGNFYGLDGVLGKGMGGGIRRWLMSGGPDGGTAA